MDGTQDDPLSRRVECILDVQGYKSARLLTPLRFVPGFVDLARNLLYCHDRISTLIETKLVVREANLGSDLRPEPRPNELLEDLASAVEHA